MNEHYWGLPGLATFIRWLEELIAILSKPFLMVGFIVSMVDLLTQGRLLDIWLIYYGWALIQAIAVDACFFVTWHKAKKAFISYHWLQFGGYALLGLALGVVAWAAMDLQSLEQAVGISNAEALARLNLNPVLLTHLRSLVAVVMGGVVAMISPEDKTTMNTKKGKSWSINFRAIAIRLGVKMKTVIPPQNAQKTLKMKPSNVAGTMTKVEQVTAKNGPQKVLPSKPVFTTQLTTSHPAKTVNLVDENATQCERFEWPVFPVQSAEYQQDFTLIEHIKPLTIESVLSESEEPVIEEQKPQSEQTASRRTMTIEEVVNATGLTERRVKNLIAKRTLKVSPRNPNLVLISSLDDWLKITPNERETKELSVVQLGTNHQSNGRTNGTS